jgi:recombination protein RecT
MEQKLEPQKLSLQDQVLAKVVAFQKSGLLKLPENYSPENALKSAWLILQDVKTKDDKPALIHCSPVSIFNSLFDMVIQGLSPLKKQCYFIPYGDKLTLIRSYFGSIAVAKRVGLEWIEAVIIYGKDVFEYGIDVKTGRKQVIKHEQKLENINIQDIKGCYAIYETVNGGVNVEIMTYKQVVQSWMQGKQKGEGATHKNFSDEMAKRTVINKACKLIINSSNDADLIGIDEEQETIDITAEIANTPLIPLQIEKEADQQKEEKPKERKVRQKEPVETKKIEDPVKPNELFDNQEAEF